nr:TadG family pilus assembly protein [Stenotrophomonas sp. PS02297]
MTTPRPRPPTHAGGARSSQVQRGGGSVMMMLLLLGLVAILGLVEIGHLYWAKREAQKVADLAALAGAQRLGLCSSDNQDNRAARQNAMEQNRFAGSITIRCGNWGIANPAADHFREAVDSDHPLNAVKVTTRRAALPFFGQNAGLPTVQAEAVAKLTPPSAVFSVGSQLLRVNGNSPLGNVLRLVGVNVDTATVLAYDGLAQAKVTPAGLLEALGLPVDVDMSVADFNRFLAANKVSLGRLLSATTTVLDRNGMAGLRLDALASRIGTQLDLDRLDLQLGSTGQAGGLFAAVVAPDGTIGSALQADVNAMDLVTTAIAIASRGRGVAVDNLVIAGGVEVRAGIIEPPSIAIGGVGARAYNAQVRVAIDIDSDKIPGLGPVLSTLGTRLKLPVYADVTNAMGTLTSLQCGQAPRTATIRVDASVLRSCVGKVAAADVFSRSEVCDTRLQNEQLLTLLGAPLINDRISIDALTGSQSLTLAEGETGSTRINPLAVGDTAQRLVDELLKVLSRMLDPRGQGMSQPTTAANLADQFLKAANPGGGRYDVDRTINLLRTGSQGLPPLDWNVSKGVPFACGLLYLDTCFRDGSVWEGYRATATGQGLGALSGLLGSLLGGLAVERCNSLLGNLDYNNCLKRNLTSYLQTAPGGLLDAYSGSGVTSPGNGAVTCNGLLCLVLKPALDFLKPLLNSVGTLLTRTLAEVLGLELGRTDVHVQSIQCAPAQLVY